MFVLFFVENHFPQKIKVLLLAGLTLKYVEQAENKFIPI
jgi:hypothetical protein